MRYIAIIIYIITLISCSNDRSEGISGLHSIKIFRSSESGEKFKLVDQLAQELDISDSLFLYPKQEYQTIRGFGGAFTQASASIYMSLDLNKRNELISAYFGSDSANYSLCRTHFNSCDFSTHSYAYDTIPNDTDLTHFSIAEDKDDLIPMILDAQNTSKDGFKLISSPWTAPPWMKDNQAWYAGKLKKEYYSTWARYFLNYYQAYRELGIPIWGFTVENEPLGNDSNWESMHYTASEMADFVSQHLGPLFKDSAIDAKLFLYDQNRDEELLKWSNELLNDSIVKSYSNGTAVHWYASTFNSFTGTLDSLHRLAPDMEIIQSEACIDNDVPRWKDDQWYWHANATDWGYDWASPEDKHLHPPYVAVHRYASDIINCLNHWVSGWIDWNMILDRNGGPNHAKNWCIAPVIVDKNTQEIYYTPLYYTMMHFSKYIRPEAKRIGFSLSDREIMATAAKNTDSSLVLVLFNPAEDQKAIKIIEDEIGIDQLLTLPANSIQTVYIQPQKKELR